MSRAVLAFGSNLAGDLSGPEAQIRDAAAALAWSSAVTPVAASAMFATPPWGVTDQDEFRNSVLVVDTELTPLELLHRCQELEQAARRVRQRHWGPRTLDIDLIDVDGLDSGERWGDELVLPHPWAHRRPFVLIPWLDATGSAGEAVLGGRPVRQWLAECPPEDSEGITALPDVAWAP